MTVATSTLIFAMLVLIAIFAVASNWLRQPYPIVFVIGGGLLAFVPGLPRVAIEPDLVFLLFLPPLLYASGIGTDRRDFTRYVQPIVALAVGLVVFTTAVVAVVAHALMGLPLATAFVLGAVVSPPDAVATEAIAKRLPLPRATKAILGGESLINDATALVIYRFALAAVASGTFSLWQASWQFVYVSVVGITIGWLGMSGLALVLTVLRRANLADETVSVLFSLVAPFVVYLAAETVHASGVLAAVTAGFVVAQKMSSIFDHEARIAAYGAWSVLIFALNGVLFMLIGLQLRFILGALQGYSPLTLAGYGLALSATVVAVRFAWVYPIAILRYRLQSRFGSHDDVAPSARGLFIVAWSGMRGIVTLATALALPVRFPYRDLIVFLAFCVIVVTLVGQGLTLPWLIRALPAADAVDPRSALAAARARVATAGLAALVSLESTFVSPTHWEVAGRMREIYERHISLDETFDAGGADSAGRIARQLLVATIGAERAALAELRRSGDIADDIYRDIQWDLDLIESRFSTAG